MRRQSSILAVREITEERWAPLGVWVVREAARVAVGAGPASGLVAVVGKNPLRRYKQLQNNVDN
jgi:hypothetical protein